MNNTTFLTNLRNSSIVFDGNMLTTLLTELINCDGKTYLDLPEFRIKELLTLSTRKVSINGELKLSETLCSIYCLCFYYSFTTNYNFHLLVEFISLAQTILCESLIIIQRCGPNRLIMSNFSEIFLRDESIETEYLLELFTETLTIAQSIGRVMLTKLRYILRNMNLKSSNKTPKKGKQENETDIDCYAPQSLYFMTSFALSAIAANLKAVNNINFIPGMLETVVVMLLTKSVNHDAQINRPNASITTGNYTAGTERHNTAATNTSMNVIAQTSAAVVMDTKQNSTANNKPLSAITEHTSRPNSGLPTTATTAQRKPVTASTLAANRGIQFNLLITSVHKLAVFMAHLLFDERTLQEIRLVRGRLVRSLTHNDCVVAQFHTSNIKLAFEHIIPARHTTSFTTVSTSPVRNTTSPHRVSSPNKQNKDKKDGTKQISAMVAWDQATSNKMNIHSEGFYFFNEAKLPFNDYYLENNPITQQLPNAALPSEDNSNSSSLNGHYSGRLLTSNTSLDGSNEDNQSLATIKTNNTGSNMQNNTNNKGKASHHAAVPYLAAVEETPRTATNRGDTSSRRSSKASSINPNNIRIDTHATAPNTAETDRRHSKDSYTPTNVGYLPNISQQPSSTSGTATPNVATLTHEQQKLKQFWLPQNKPFRSVYLLLDSLPNKNKPAKVENSGEKSRILPIKSLFSADYVPAKCKSIEMPKVIGDLLEIEGISEYPVTETVRFIENQYYELSDLHFTPRFLNPTEEIYWICSYAIDYIHKQTLAGGGFHPSTEDEIKGLKQRVKHIKQCNKQINALSVTLPSLIPQMKIIDKHPHTHTRQKQLANVLKNTHKEQQSQDKQKGKRVLNLAEKLSLAVKEATAESKLYEMERKIKQQQIDAQLAWEAQHLRTHSANGNGNGTDATGQTMESGLKLGVSFSNIEELHKMLANVKETKEIKNKEDAEKIEPLSSEPLTRPSAVWHCKPKVIFVRKQDFSGYDVELEKVKDNPLLGLPSKEQSKDYAAKIAKQKQAEKEAEAKFKLMLVDQTESIIADTRTNKAQTLKNLRQKIKDDIVAKNEFKAHWEEERRQLEIQEKLAYKQAQKEKNDAEFRERMKIAEIKMKKQMEEGQAAMQLANELSIQKIKIREMADKKEAKEIIRRNKEEARMKYLEERRRIVDRKLDEEYAKIKAVQDAKSNDTLAIRDAIQGRVRMGNFMWHNGVYGFYDNVQKEPIGWIQYEDASGRPYYYDPKNNITQYRLPVDAPIRHYTEDERKEYDAIYGEGAYDAYKADIAFKDGVNRDGGYWNEQGEWTMVNGYYDENYEFIQYDGYYDDNGKYIKYAKASGNLNFMV